VLFRSETNDSPSALIAAVEHGIGLSFVSLLEAAPRLALGSLSIVDVQGVNLSTEVHLGYSNAHISSPVQLKFKAFIEHPQTAAQTTLLTQGHLIGMKHKDARTTHHPQRA
jgi:DNA-binding transcriptional LysR family regulator